MASVIKEIISALEIDRIRRFLQTAEWEDGRNSGGASRHLKQCQQINVGTPDYSSISDMLLSKCISNPSFVAQSIPEKILTANIEKYSDKDHFEAHIENAIRADPLTHTRVRSDLIATIMLSEPHEYVGGDIIIEDSYGSKSFRLNAGDMLIYSSSSLCEIGTIQVGLRYTASFTIQSAIKDDAARGIIGEIDRSIQFITDIDHDISRDDLNALIRVYQNLTRMYSEVA